MVGRVCFSVVLSSIPSVCRSVGGLGPGHSTSQLALLLPSSLHCQSCYKIIPKYIHDGYGKERAVRRARGLRNCDSSSSPVNNCARAGQKLRQALPHSSLTKSTRTLLFCAQHRLGLPHGLADRRWLCRSDICSRRPGLRPAAISSQSWLGSQYKVRLCRMLCGQCSASTVYASVSCIRAGLQSRSSRDELLHRVKQELLQLAIGLLVDLLSQIVCPQWSGSHTKKPRYASALQRLLVGSSTHRDGHRPSLPRPQPEPYGATRKVSQHPRTAL